MRLVVQRVLSASVAVEGEITGEIGKGYMVLVGFSEDDGIKEAEWCKNKLMKLRIFEDENNSMNVNIKDAGGELLLIPQFTLYGDVIKNNRPNFRRAMSPDKASELFDYFFDKCSEEIHTDSEEIHTEKGVFGAFMDVKLNNYGPVTIIVEKEFKD